MTKSCSIWEQDHETTANFNCSKLVTIDTGKIPNSSRTGLCPKWPCQFSSYKYLCAGETQISDSSHNLPKWNLYVQMPSHLVRWFIVFSNLFKTVIDVFPYFCPSFTLEYIGLSSTLLIKTNPEGFFDSCDFFTLSHPYLNHPLASGFYLWNMCHLVLHFIPSDTNIV